MKMSRLMKQMTVKKETSVLEGGKGLLVLPNKWRLKIQTLQKAGRNLTGILHYNGTAFFFSSKF